MASSFLARTRRRYRNYKRSRPTPKKGGFRTDIQGLRTFAVVVVVLDHLFAWPRGGFVGVDVFFVISGFLITGLLLREYDRSGTISFVGFYRSRIKRIVPAATLVLVFTVVVSYLLFFQGRAIGVMWDAIWAFVWVANWNFAIKGTDYFQSTEAVSPLQHFWSLSVEEQFYFVWPWLLLLVLFVLAKVTKRKDPRSTRVVAGVLIGVIFAASLGWALIQSTAAPTSAYFSTATRTWELAIGALLAVIAPVFFSLKQPARVVMAYLGLLGMVVSLFVIDSSSVWPAPWALLPTLSTALVLASGAGEQAKWLWPLTNPVSRYIGDISYSLYLWHWPIIVFGLALFPDSGTVVYAGILVVSFGFAIIAFHMWERPMHKSPVFVRYPSTAKMKEAWRDWRSAHGQDYKVGYYGVIALAAGAVVTIFAVSGTIPDTVTTASTSTVGAGSEAQNPAPAAVTAPPEAYALSEKITAALASSSWPEVTPSLDALGRGALVPEWVVDGCLGQEQGSSGTPEENAEGCVYGDPNAERTAVVLGDSVAISWMPAIRAALEPDGWRILVFTDRQCPASTVTMLNNDGTPHQQCDPFRTWAFAKIAEIHPQLVIASESASAHDKLASDAAGAAAMAEISRGATQTALAVAPSTDAYVVLSSPPLSASLTKCATRGGNPADCVSTPGSSYRAPIAAVREGLADAAQPNARFIDTKSFFCSADGRCPPFVDGTIVNADGIHMTAQYSGGLGPVLREALFPVG